MKKFSFSYERAMDWREKKAEQERQELQRLHMLRSTLEQRKTDLASAVEAASSALAQAENISGTELRTNAAYLASLRTSALDLLSLQARCHSDIDAQTRRCVSADRDFRLLANLREQRFASWRYQCHREEEQTAAEVWQAGNTRRRG
jgi:hypothetical protein